MIFVSSPSGRPQLLNLHLIGDLYHAQANDVAAKEAPTESPR